MQQGKRRRSQDPEQPRFHGVCYCACVSPSCILPETCCIGFHDVSPSRTAKKYEKRSLAGAEDAEPKKKAKKAKK